VAAAVLSGVGSGCYSYDPLYCTRDADCADQAVRTYCDSQGVHRASDYVAHTCIAPPEHSVALEVTDDIHELRVGDTISIEVRVTRSEGFKEPVEITAGTSSSLQAEAVTIAGDADVSTLTVRADADAPFGPTSLGLHATMAGATTDANINLFLIGQPGHVDESFGSAAGSVLLDVLRDAKDGVATVFAQGDKIVVVLHSLQLFRFTQQGALDRTFGVDGRAAPILFSYAIPSVTSVAGTVDSDGRLLFALAATSSDGSADLALVRLTIDGQLDPTFVPHLVDTHPHHQLPQVISELPDGRIVVLGHDGDMTGRNDRSIIWCFDRDGNLDGQRRELGEDTVYVLYGAIIQDDGRIVFEGIADNRVSRLNLDGSIDRSFPEVTLPSPNGIPARWTIARRVGDRILFAGNRADNFAAVWRLTASGEVDASFGGEGFVVIPKSSKFDPEIVLGMHDLQGGDVLGFIQAERPKLFRVKVDGALDTSFGIDGTMQDSVMWYPGKMALLGRHGVALVGLDEPRRRLMVRRYWY